MQFETVNITVTDAIYVKRYRQGDSKAMEALVIKYQDRIYNVILKMCGNADDAAELTQEAFVKAMVNINKFEDRSGFYTWLFRIAVNLTITYCQKRAKRVLKSLDAEYNQDNNQAKVTLKNSLAIAQKKELCETVAKLLMKLDTNQRAVVLLRDVEGMNYAQIADVLNIKPGTVKSRINRARTALQKILNVLPCNNTAGNNIYLSVAE
ncbi:MAG: RNA polymerase sigma factor [Planctomycetota bacterium]